MANSDKTMDVSKPGKVAADASAKPIIVTHRPMVQDPMMKPATEVSDLEPQKDNPRENKSTPTSGEKVIQPIDKDLKASPSEIDKAAAAAAAPKQKATSEPNDVVVAGEEAETSKTPDEPVVEEAKSPPKEATEETAEETTEDVKEEPTKESSTSDVKTDKPEPSAEKEASTTPKDEIKKSSSTSEAAEVDAMVDQAAAGKHKEKQEAEQEAAKLEHLQKLTDEKKYFVKTGQVARRRNNRIALAFLVLIVLVVGLYLAVDAGVLKPGFNVPVHVIKT